MSCLNQSDLLDALHGFTVGVIAVLAFVAAYVLASWWYRRKP